MKQPSEETTRAIAKLAAMAEELQAICGSVSVHDLNKIEIHERQLVLLIESAATQYIDGEKKRKASR